MIYAPIPSNITSRKANDMAIGEAISAVYVGAIVRKTYLPSHLIRIEGETIKLYGTRVLNKKLGLVSPGDKIKITCTEDRISNKGIPYKNFHVDFLNESGYSVKIMLEAVTWNMVVASHRDAYAISQRSPANYSMHCIFCKSKRSLDLYVESKRYFCHSCSETGDILNFLSKIERDGLAALCQLYKSANNPLLSKSASSRL